MLKITHCCSCLFGASGNMITVIILLIRGTYHSLECKYSARVIVSHQQNTTYSICTELSCWYYYFQRMNMFFLFLIHHSSWLVTERSRGCSMRQVKRGVMVVNAEEMKKYTWNSGITSSIIIIFIHDVLLCLRVACNDSIIWPTWRHATRQTNQCAN